MLYDRNTAIAYAHEWAFRRNPKYYNFDPVGGDCTNFVSQCIFAGCGEMNYTKDIGWYYISSSNRAAAWAGVEYLYRFLTSNGGPGPRAVERPMDYVQAGDVIQLSFDGLAYTHTMLVVEAGYGPENILVAAHTHDADNKPLARYVYMNARLLHAEF